MILGFINSEEARLARAAARRRGRSISRSRLVLIIAP